MFSSSHAQKKETERLIEKKRILNFANHAEIIGRADQFDYHEMKQRILNLKPLYDLADRLNDSHYIGMPLNNGYNFFQAIFNHPGLEEKQKRELILILLLNSGYEYFYKEVFESPKLFELFFADGNEFKKLYQGLLNCNVYPEIEHAIKSCVWDKLITTNIEETLEIFAALSACKAIKSDQFLNFVMCWLKKLETEVDVLRAFKSMKPYLDRSQHKEDLEDIRVLVKLRLDNIHALNPGPASIPHVKKEVKKLLKSGHVFFSCIRTDPAYELYDQIDKYPQGDFKKQLENLERRAEDKINDRHRKEERPPIRVNM